MRQYIVDAFTDKVFSGNQAAVCVMDSWPEKQLMMNIARENNFSETAFTVKEGNVYRLRWFTPKVEIDLCGHATLAAAYVVLRFYEHSKSVTFTTMRGELTVTRHDDMYAMDFPAYELESVPVSEAMRESLGVMPEAAYMGRDLLCVLNSEEAVRKCVPNQAKISELDGMLVHITARGHEGEADCVSRSFAPKLGISEDPVCGSGHCHIVPYWSKILGRRDITAYQASERGGYLYCRDEDERVVISGKAALYSRSEILEEE
ncbi:MAG: PhzF family phenazine biosynthesis protein [Synergistaceae bacterium]|nr:PhzF family phenazine biosynthesis protein [Synergistaceae bacterium]